MIHNKNTLLLQSIFSALKAGEEILKIYNTDFNVDYKSDNTPVTLADKQASQIIVKDLIPFNIPVISEEEAPPSFEKITTYKLFWLIDPLDGTREFIKKNGEFTVNIALIENNTSILGVVYAPVLKQLYFAMNNFGSFKITDKNLQKIQSNSSLENIISYAVKLPQIINTNTYTIVTSRSHLDTKTLQYIEAIKQKKGEIEILKIGSSLKLCLLAEGMANEYPRFGRTMEWDIAAGHAVLKEAGGEIYTANNLQPFIYGKTDLTNPDFIALSKKL